MTTRSLAADDADWRFTVSGAAMLGLVRFAEALHVGGPGFTAGLEAAAWSDPECRVRQGDYHLLWERLAARSTLSAPGLVAAEQSDLDSFGVVLHLASGSATFSDALAKLSRYARLLHDAGRIEVERQGDRAFVYPGCRDQVAVTPRHVAEFSAGSVVSIGRLLTGQAWDPLMVTFRHPAPADTSAHRRLFGVLPTFDAPETVVVLKASTLDLPLPGSQASLTPFLEAFAARALQRLPVPTDGLEAAVKRLVLNQLTDDTCDAASVAGVLGIHPRTLRRHLAARGTSFQAVRDAVRLEHATTHLAAGRLAIADIGYLLGYADPANFHRAFKRWTGKAPSVYRSNAQAR